MTDQSPFRMRFRAGEVAVNMPVRSTLMNEIRKRLINGRGFALATVNLDHLVKLRNGGAFRRAYDAQDFVVADGNPIVWLSRLARKPVELIPGSDLVLPLTRIAAEEGATVALIGANDDTLQAAATRLRAETPELNIVYQRAPSYGFDPEGAEADEILADLAASGAQLALIALGAPKQEIFAARGRAKAPKVGFASIGASLDFLAGSQKRAPFWVRKLALEWVWRMAGNPRRLMGRYLQCAMILPSLALGALGPAEAADAGPGGEAA